jgi:hypothetical protein
VRSPLSRYLQAVCQDSQARVDLALRHGLGGSLMLWPPTVPEGRVANNSLFASVCWLMIAARTGDGVPVSGSMISMPFISLMPRTSPRTLQVRFGSSMPARKRRPGWL